MKKLGGFQPRFPLYRTETHLSGFQRRAPNRIQTLKTQKLKEKYLLKKQTNPDIKAQALAIFCR